MTFDEAYAVVVDHLETHDVFGEYADREPTNSDVEAYVADCEGNELDPDAPDDEVDEVTLAVRVLSRV